MTVTQGNTSPPVDYDILYLTEGNPAGDIEETVKEEQDILDWDYTAQREGDLVDVDISLGETSGYTVFRPRDYTGPEGLYDGFDGIVVGASQESAPEDLDASMYIPDSCSTDHLLGVLLALNGADDEIVMREVSSTLGLDLYPGEEGFEPHEREEWIDTGPGAGEAEEAAVELLGEIEDGTNASPVPRTASYT